LKSNRLELTINLSKIYTTRRTKRAARAARYIRELIRKRTHAERVLIDEKINKLLWSRGIEKPPRKVRILITVEESEEVKTKDGKTMKIPKIVRVSLPAEEKEASKQAAS